MAAAAVGVASGADVAVMVAGISTSSPESGSTSQKMLPRAESSMIRPFGAVSVAGVEIERGRSGSSATGISVRGFQSSAAADSSLMGLIMRA